MITMTIKTQNELKEIETKYARKIYELEDITKKPGILYFAESYKNYCVGWLARLCECTQPGGSFWLIYYVL